MDAAAYLIDGPEEIQSEWLVGKRCVGLTAGASAPEVLVERVVQRLRELGATAVIPLAGEAETVSFPLPRFL